MNNEFFSQLSMQLQDPNNLSQMAASPYDPWAVMMQLQRKFEMKNGGPLQPGPADQASKQPNLGALLSGGAGLMKQAQPQAMQPLPLTPMQAPTGGRPAPVPQAQRVATQQPMNIGQLLSRGAGYGV